MRKIFLILVTLVLTQGCLDQKRQAESIFRHYLDRKTNIIRNYTKESSLALWTVTVSGKKEDYQKLVDLELDFSNSNRNNPRRFNPDHFSAFTQNVFTNQEDFELLRKLKDSGLITDTLLSRQLIYLYHSFMSALIDSVKYKKMLDSENKLEMNSSSLKLNLNGKDYCASQLDSIRKTTNNSVVLEKILQFNLNEARKKAPDIVQMVKARNEVANALGLSDYYHVLFEEKDESPERVQSLIDEIEQKTRHRYLEAKKVVDKKLAKYYGIKAEELRPWHYNDERTSYMPANFRSKLDSLLSTTDPVTRAASFFDGIALNIQNVIDKSELRKGNTNAMINIDFRNDVRLIGRVTNSFDGLTKMMHLGGHAAHYSNIPEDIPYLLQGPSLIIAEGVARYFENLAYNPDWFIEQVKPDKKTEEQVRLIFRHYCEVDQLFRIRKQMVFAEFEREIYKNPDQDLDLLWRKLNLKYLDIHFPEGKGDFFWAISSYFTKLPGIIHHYILADMVAAHLKHAIQLRTGSANFMNNIQIGQYFKGNLFGYGDLMPWEKLVEKATGEPVNTRYFINELVGEEENTRAQD